MSLTSFPWLFNSTLDILDDKRLPGPVSIFQTKLPLSSASRADKVPSNVLTNSKGLKEKKIVLALELARENER